MQNDLWRYFMARPRNCRKVKGRFDTTFFKPAGVPKHALEEVTLAIDEIEAMRLADYDGLYQADAAEKMGVSRQTLGNILKSARKKVTDALIHGKSIKLEGGSIEFQEFMFHCRGCGAKFADNIIPAACPDCESTEIDSSKQK